MAASRWIFDLACLTLASLAHVASGHGRMIVPQARNMRDNGAVGGGPGSVHGANKYQHGICGNPASATQTYNRVGEVQSTFQAGEVAEIKLVITAHHVGFFEVELCTNAGQLSEECFASHRLLREGCTCSCPGDSSNGNACSECDECRRWWKPVVEVEENLYVTQGLGRSYSGPVLPGGNLVPYEFTLRYKIPAGVKTSRGVLRWHYVTTNSCTSQYASPEEFWNCADVAVTDNGDAGPAVSFDNSALEQLHGENLFSKMSSGALAGVYSGCPKDGSGNLIGVGTAQEYSGLCGAQVGGVYEYCRSLSSGSSAGSSSSGSMSGGYPSGGSSSSGGSGSGASNTPSGTGAGGSSDSASDSTSSVASGAGSTAGAGADASGSGNTQGGTSASSGSEAAGSGGSGTGEASGGASSSWPASTISGDCDHVPSSGVLCESDCSTAWFQCHNGVAFTQPVPAGTRCKDNQFVHEVQCANFDPATGTDSGAAEDPKCANCNTCVFSNNVCYDTYNTQASCMQWPSNTWCGGQSLAEVGAHVYVAADVHRHEGRRKGARKENFLGVAFVQDKVTVGRTTGDHDEASSPSLSAVEDAAAGSPSTEFAEL